MDSDIAIGRAGDIASTLPLYYAMIIIFGALVVVWIIGVIMSCSYMIKDLQVVRTTRGRTQSLSHGRPTANR